MAERYLANCLVQLGKEFDERKRKMVETLHNKFADAIKEAGASSFEAILALDLTSHELKNTWLVRQLEQEEAKPETKNTNGKTQGQTATASVIS